MHTAKPNKYQSNETAARNEPEKRDTPSDVPDAALLVNNEAMIKQVISRDPKKGCEMIFRKYYQSLCGHVVRFVYSKEIAEDIVSDVFLNFCNNKVYENITSSYRAYLYSAVRNRAISFLKAEFNDTDRITTEHSLIGNANDTNPETILLHDELFSEIEQIINALPPQCRKVFILSRFEGRKYREIALDLQIKTKTVEAHMMKALALLKKSLQEYFKNN